MKILVVGSGSAGLIAATTLKKKFNFTVDVVSSSEIGIVGVGEGSTEHFSEYLHFMQIDPYEVICKTDATYKTGIMFRGWAEEDYLHNVDSDFAISTGQYHHVYANQISEGSSYMSSTNLKNNLLSCWFLNRKESNPANQFHFDTHKLNLFLTNVAKAMGVKFYDDEINRIELLDSGEISVVLGKSGKVYDYDFYIDSTGFKQLLIGKMGAKWISFKEHLKMNSAITFQTKPDSENINLWTTAQAMNNGWMFSLPTWNHLGNGYIYDKEYADTDSIVSETESFLNKSIEIGKSFSFDPGHLDRPWIKNCFSVGISSSFVEPLEATSIGSSIQQSFLLCHYLSKYTEKDIQSYNKSFVSIMQNIRDFVFLHYITKKNNTKFWRDVSNISPPESLKCMLDLWKYRLPVEEDFNEVSKYKLFGAKNFIVVLHGLGLFDRESIKEQLESMSDEIRYDAINVMKNRVLFDEQHYKVSHKKFIEFIRNYHENSF